MLAETTSLTLDALTANLIAHPKVDAIALFGSRSTDTTNPVSDYDLLILLDNPPVQLFQLQTYVSHILTDVAFAETITADRVLALEHPVPAMSGEGFLIGWLHNAHILYDRSGRFDSIQQKLGSGDWRTPASTADTYADWFWLNLDLRHMKRMAASDDPIYLLTVDVHLASSLGNLWRAYYQARGLHWRGVKGAARYLSTHDPDYLTQYQTCLTEPDRQHRLALFEHLVARTLNADVWADGKTALYLKEHSDHPHRIPEALAFWQALING